MRTEIAAQDAVNSHAQVSAAESHGAMGSVYGALGDKTHARVHFVKAMTILDELRQNEKLPPALAPIYDDVKERAAAFVR